MIRFVKAALLALVVQGCATTQTFSAAPNTRVEWYGKSAIQPWPGLEQAIIAADQVIAEEYPGLPALRSYVVLVFGANDHFSMGECVNAEMIGGVPHLLSGCTCRAGASHTWYVLVRQILSERAYLFAAPCEPPSTTGLLCANKHMPSFSGALFDAGTQGRSNDEMGRGVFFWEIADRLVPAILYELGKTTSDGKPPVSSHGGDGEQPAPANVALRNKMIARYKQLYQ